jgi:AAA domain/Winged helix-turn-helix DNA-binding
MGEYAAGADLEPMADLGSNGMCDLEDRGRNAGVYFTAAELMDTEFAEPRWAVNGLIAEGLNLIVGSPKLGKSWLCLGLAVAIASGGKALGKIQVDQGAVLYAALEDTPRRLQNRLRMVLQGERVPEDLHITTALPRMPDAIGFIDGWLEAHQDARLVIVDVLRKIRPPTTGRDFYGEDYDVMSSLKQLADRHAVAVLVVHHTRKSADESDVFNEVSGSTGLTGAADAILIAKRARNTAEAVLHVTGRDITEQEYGLSWRPESCTWTLLDEPVHIATMGTTRRQILTLLSKHPASTPAQVAEGLGIDPATARQTLRRMATDLQLESDGEGRYAPPGVTVTPVTVVTLLGDSDNPSDSTSKASVQVRGLSDSSDMSDSTCRDCGYPLDPSLLAAGDRYHPTCGAA